MGEIAKPQRRQKIVIATLTREQGETGVHTHFNVFKNYLLANGIEAIAITPFSFYLWLVVPVFAIRKLIDKLSGPLSVWWYRYWHYFFLKQALVSQLAEQAQNNLPVIIYAQEPLAAKAALEARSSEQQKVVMIVHFNGSQADEWVGKGKIKRTSRVYQEIKQLESSVLTSVDGIVYTTHFMKQLIEKNIPFATRIKSTILPCFVPKNCSKASKTSIKPTGDLINIGTLEARKNQSYLLQVLAESKKRGKQYSLTLVGHGIDQEKLTMLAQNLGVDQQVKFMGFQKNAAQLLANHQVYVHSALIESFGIVLVEAMSYGLPLLAGAVGGVVEVFSDGVEGFYWPLENPAAGAEKLIRLMEDVDKRNEMAQAAQTRFFKSFELSVVADQLLAFLYEVSETGSASADTILSPTHS